MYVLLSGVVFFRLGRDLLAVSLDADRHVRRRAYATTNYGFLYMAQGVGSVLGGPLAATLKGAVGGWIPVFSIVIGLDFLTAILALFVLKRMRAEKPYPVAPALAAAE